MYFFFQFNIQDIKKKTYKTYKDAFCVFVSYF